VRNGGRAHGGERTPQERGLTPICLVVSASGQGRTYARASRPHYRRDVDGIVTRLGASGLGGFAFVHASANETIEIFCAGPGVLELPSAA